MSESPTSSQAVPNRVTLPRSMEMETIWQCYELLRPIAEAPPPEVVVDMGEIALVDASAVQLMLAFMKTLESKGSKVSWDNLSVQLYQEATTLGLEGELGY